MPGVAVNLQHPSILLVKPTYVTEEEFEQMNHSALVASSQSTNQDSPTLSSRPSHPPSNPDSQTISHSLPITSDAVPFTGADDDNLHSTYSLPYLSFDE
ncbi:hypothetical protein DSO57_1022016 [Entomophthora muscae]|uniref:Uncharacterized protein n=1 Tax=Entomophthora muscae TaxID=34485 RepID=A0ACC2TE15_9FUNG|nr:hypothetical protein DSO57_1022016 [Entomophthora muscae]